MKFRKILKAFALSLAGITAAFFLFWIASSIYYQFSPPPEIEYGVTFSPSYTESLGLNPEETYQDILRELKVKHIRIPVYWNLVEKKPGVYNFDSYDRLLSLSRERNVKVTLVLGYKVPRWPECYAPTDLSGLPDKEFQEKILKLIEAEINHFKGMPEVIAWQIENEPLLKFGKCRMFDGNFLKREVELTKKLDSRPVILTDSGERGFWMHAMKNSDIFGTTLYRTVWDEVFGYIRYPIPPFYYPLRSLLTQWVFAPNSQETLISELQAEPWPPSKPLSELSAEEQAKNFSLDNLKEVVDYATQTNIKKQYFWGVEWWYLMKKQGNPQYWEYAKGLFR